MWRSSLVIAICLMLQLPVGWALSVPCHGDTFMDCHEYCQENCPTMGTDCVYHCDNGCGCQVALVIRNNGGCVKIGQCDGGDHSYEDEPAPPPPAGWSNNTNTPDGDGTNGIDDLKPPDIIFDDEDERL